MPRRTLAQRRDAAALEMALLTELVAGTPGQRDAEWWVAVAARVCARHRISGLGERACNVPRPPKPPPPPRSALTRRQAEVLRAIADHGSVDAVATALGRSPDTVRTQTAAARRALHAPNTLTAVATALRAGLIA